MKLMFDSERYSRINKKLIVKTKRRLEAIEIKVDQIVTKLSTELACLQVMVKP